MRRLLCTILLGALAGASPVLAQSDFAFVGRAYSVPGGGATSFGLRCPPGLVLSQVHHSAEGGLRRLTATWTSASSIAAACR